MNVKPEWTIEAEAMGGREKFWYEVPEDQHRWLFKYPRARTGEHWAEKVAAEVAVCLAISHAAVELAVAGESRGSISKSFVPKGQVLRHGNELLARVLAGKVDYDAKKLHGQSDHSLENIFGVLEAEFRIRRFAEIAKQQFAGYLVLDALIGNTDRHHQNWGLLVRRTPTGLPRSLAPTFDHASSLGRELGDERRARHLQEKRVGSYSRKARGRVYWAGSDRYGPSPAELVRLAAAKYPELFQVPLARVRDRGSRIEAVVRRVPDDWMSPTAKDFTVALLDYNATELEKCLK